MKDVGFYTSCTLNLDTFLSIYSIIFSTLKSMELFNLWMDPALVLNSKLEVKINLSFYHFKEAQ